MQIIIRHPNSNQIAREWDDDTETYREFDVNGVETFSRLYDAEEKAEAAARAAQLVRDSAAVTLVEPSKIDASIAEIEARIGSGDYVATGITDPAATIKALLNMTNANLATDFSANTGRWLKFLLRTDKRLSNETIRLLRLVGERLDSTSVGDET